jgi:hypothetical protein
MLQAAGSSSSVFLPSPCFGVKFVNNYGQGGVAGLQEKTDKGDLAIDRETSTCRMEKGE